MSYWTPEDVVQIDEKQISIPAELGLNYTVGNVERKVQFEVPPSVKFIDGENSYLEFDMLINYPDLGALFDSRPTRLQCDPAGAGMICRNIRIYDGGRGNLIEEINEYNQLVALRSDYDTDQSKVGTSTLMEGATNYNARTQGTLGNTKSDMADLQTNPWFKAVPAGDRVAADLYITNDTAAASGQFNTVHCCVPLKTGVFTGSLYPNLLTGLYIEIDLAPAPRIVRQLDSVVKTRRRTLNPQIERLLLADDSAAVLPLAAGAATEIKTIELSIANRQTTVDKCPFVVGEIINIGSSVATDAGRATLDANLQAVGGAAYTGGIISEIKVVGGKIQLTLDSAVTNAAAAGGRGFDIAAGSSVFSVSVSEATSMEVTYTISDLNLVINEVGLDARYEASMLQKARDGSAIEFDVHSVTNYKNSMLASERQASFLIHANNHKAKSLLVIPTDSSVYTNQQLLSSTAVPTAAGAVETYETTADEMDMELCSARSGISGCCDFLSSVQYQLNGKLVPSRPVSTRKIATRKSIDAFHVFELEKSLANAGITPHSFKNYMNNFVLGRGFAVNSGVLDLRDKDLSVQLNYSETTAPTKPKMMSSFVFHIRRLMIKNGGVSVQM
mgnify:FL=1|tara:strand:- start:2435 stop:4279 length:1845 start_codon:yes stop_codon:yes gene_type:complete